MDRQLHVNNASNAVLLIGLTIRCVYDECVTLATSTSHLNVKRQKLGLNWRTT